MLLRLARGTSAMLLLASAWLLLPSPSPRRQEEHVFARGDREVARNLGVVRRRRKRGEHVAPLAIHDTENCVQFTARKKKVCCERCECPLLP